MIEIMDTTLRDGEQTSGVSFAAHEKLSIAQMLVNELGVDRLEIASARVSDGEFEGVKKVAEWARRSNNLHKLEVLGFVDGGASLQWIEKAGCRVINLLAKGSYKHVAEQLRRNPEQHFEDIRKEVSLARQMGIDVNIYLETWSNGMIDSPDYVFRMIDTLKDLPIKRFMIPDTLGILNPLNTYEYCKQMVERYPDLQFDFHAHNDYDLAVANVFSAVRAGIKGIHTTVNGLGERAGNAPLSSVLAIIKDQLHEKTNLKEEKINKVSRLVESFSGIRVAPNRPIVG
ncbi:MAG: 2-isopropylmalate synthase, partial [Tannerellaceae bacterium]|nr:2-isopropylmalate synthase [Tannerellaceae bacterium]